MEYVSYVRLVFFCCFLRRGTYRFATRGRRPKKRPSERLYPYELQHSRPHLMAPTTAHRKAWVLCTSATHLNFKAPKKELLYEAGLLAHYCKHSVRDKKNLKAGDTRTPTYLLASLSYWIYWRTDRQKCWSAFPAHAVGEVPCTFQPTGPIRVVLSWHLKECFVTFVMVRGWVSYTTQTLTIRRLCCHFSQSLKPS